VIRVGPEERAGPERARKAEPAEARRVEPVAREAGSEHPRRRDLCITPREGARRKRRRTAVHRRAAQRAVRAPVHPHAAAARSIDRTARIWRGPRSAGARDPAVPAEMRPTAAGAARDCDPRVPARREMPGPAVVTAEMLAGMAAEMHARPPPPWPPSMAAAVTTTMAPP
jgi:hypothetical protein